jgi:hypothetical protein
VRRGLGLVNRLAFEFDQLDLGLLKPALHPVPHGNDLVAGLPSRDLEQLLGVTHHQLQISHKFVPSYDLRAIHVQNLLDNCTTSAGSSRRTIT